MTSIMLGEIYIYNKFNKSPTTDFIYFLLVAFALGNTSNHYRCVCVNMCVALRFATSSLLTVGNKRRQKKIKNSMLVLV